MVKMVSADLGKQNGKKMVSTDLYELNGKKSHFKKIKDKGKVFRGPLPKHFKGAINSVL